MINEVSTNRFRKEGEFWTIAFENEVVHLRDAKGLRYIAALLRRPRTKIHAVELREPVRAATLVGEPAERERARLMVTQRIKASLRKIAAMNPALGDHLHRTLHTGTYCGYEPPEPVSW